MHMRDVHTQNSAELPSLCEDYFSSIPVLAPHDIQFRLQFGTGISLVSVNF